MEDEFPYEMMTEGFNTNKEYVIEQFKNGYIDPKLYHSFLCKWYKTDIILFNKNGLTNKDYFFLTTPYYRIKYQSIETYDKFILICLNQGNETSPQLYPLCELIYLDNNTFFFTDKPFYDYIQETLHHMYGKTKRILPDFIKNDIISQSLNEYNETNWVFTNKFHIYLIEPIHSLSKPINRNVTRDITIDSNDLEEWFDANNIMYQENDNLHPLYKGYEFTYEGYHYFIKTSLKKDINMLHKYKLYEQYARYLQEYMFYEFSVYWNKSLLTINDNNIYEYISDFVEQKIIIDNDLFNDEYKENINRNFTSDNFLYKLSNSRAEDNNKNIYVDNNTVRKKLIYSLLNQYKFHRNKLRDYHKETNMRNYYKETYDFTPYHNHIILDEKSIQNYMNHKYISHGYYHIKKDAVYPYVLYKKITEINPNSTKYLMQPIDNVSSIMVLYKKWKKNKTNDWKNIITYPEEKEEPLQINQLNWVNQIEYELITNNPNLPYCSFLWLSDTKCIIHLMLPLN